MKDFMKKDFNYILPTYKRHNLLLIKGKGKYVWNHENKRFLDFFSGLSVTNVGHVNPKVLRAVKKQSGKLMHVSNLYYTMPQIKLAQILSRRSLNGRVFFCNSGSESTETAIKIAKKFGRGERDEIIVFHNSFHGRTLGALSATVQMKFQKNFMPLVPGFKFAVFNDMKSVTGNITPRTCAIMLEPIQGEGGVNVADKNFLRDIREISSEKDIKLIFDEVQCGLGRTGKLFAYEHFGVEPDILCMAKGLGGGLPLGAAVVNPKLNSIFGYGDHGSTFGGNPVSCSAGIEVLNQLNDKLLSRVSGLGRYFLNLLVKLKSEFPVIKDVRGVGLMIGMELNKPGMPVVEFAQSKKLLLNCTNDTVIRFLPPFIINNKDIDYAISVLREALKKC
ncbi:MAG: aspartate aminotransferase family protein [bacterium]